MSRKKHMLISPTILMIGIAMFLLIGIGGHSIAGEPSAHADYPPSGIEYRDGKLFIRSANETKDVIFLEDLDLGNRYPHLVVKEGFILERAVYALVGGDTIGYIIAIDSETGNGFAIEYMNWTQGAFIFAPLTGSEAALEYVQFMVHETGLTLYIREYTEIRDQEEFERVTTQMNETAIDRGSELEIIAEPPVNFTTISIEGGEYSVERVFLKQIGQERLVYSRLIAYGDGRLETVEEYVFMRGAPGPVPTPYVADLNGDWKVDMRDVGYVARHFMCVPGDPLWDSNADVNGDGRINMTDIGTVAWHFGEHYP